MIAHFLFVDPRPQSDGKVSGVCACKRWQGSFSTRANLEGEHKDHRVEASLPLPRRVPTVDRTVAAADLILNNPAAVAVYFSRFEQDVNADAIAKIRDAMWELALDDTDVMATLEREMTR